MSIYKRLHIKSDIRNYSVFFVNDFKDGWDKYCGKKAYLIVDYNVAKYYNNELAAVFKKYPYMIVKASEEHKTLEYVKKIIRRLIDNGVKKNHILIAVGGGIIQDLTGFVASILYRGVEWFFFPTTLLAQSDSCIGSKTSINVDEYKNQVGNFYPPSNVFLNSNFLKTLKSSDMKSGLGEIIKVHLLNGENSLKYMLKKYDQSLSDLEVMNDLIFRSLKIKKNIIEKDEFDTGYRNILNYGHTFGHALESLTGYNLPHGQAVTIGMDISNYLSHKLRLISKSTYLVMREMLLKNSFNYNLKHYDFKLFFESLSRDKKNAGNKITVILTKGPGRMIKKGLAMDAAAKNKILSFFKQQ